MSVKRFDIEHSHGEPGYSFDFIGECKDGDYVEYSEYMKKAKQIEAFERLIDDHKDTIKDMYSHADQWDAKILREIWHNYDNRKQEILEVKK